MTTVYNDEYYLSIYKQKKRIFNVFWAVTACYAAFCIAWLVYHISLPYNDPMLWLPKLCVYVASALYVAFCFPYLGIKGSRIRRYYKMLTYVSIGLKGVEKNYFYSFREKSLQKDNIDVVGCVFETWNKKKSEWMDREAYWDVELPYPAFESGDYVQYIVQSNFIIQYEILQKQALEFEEVDEEEYEEDGEENYLPEGADNEESVEA